MHFNKLLRDQMSFRNDLIHALMELERELGSLNQVALKLRVDRAGLKRFIDDERGLTSKTLEKILAGLGGRIVFDVPAKDIGLSTTRYEQYVAEILYETSRILGKTAEGIAGKGFGGRITSGVICEMLAGTRGMTVYDFYRICMAIGVSASDVLQRASELCGRDSSKGLEEELE